MQLTQEMRESLVSLAADARKTSYSPYSHFAVGAALMCANGRTFTGANIENASYPCGICAEKVAYAKAITECPGEPIIAIAVVAEPLGSSEVVTPCGNCRQFMSEFGKETIVICAKWSAGEQAAVIGCQAALSELLPASFSSNDLF